MESNEKSAKQEKLLEADSTVDQATERESSIVDSMYESVVYGLSLPERTVRSVAALASGAAGESAAILIPRAFQDSKSYRVFVQQMIDMLSHDVGGVQKNVPVKTKLT